MYRQTVLANGVRVVTLSMKERDSASLGFMVGTGGRYEDDSVKGAAHFLEHILFKGSRKYTCTQIKEMIEGVGGSLNAFTSEEKTCYYAKIPAEYFCRAFQVLADMVLRPLIAPEDVAKERAVILEEIKMYHDLPHYYVLDLLDGLTWPDHPLGKSLIGSTESISRMRSEDLRGFRDEHYSPKNIVVAACGRVRHRDVVDRAERIFSKTAPGREIPFIVSRHVQDAPRTCFSRRDIEQMHLALGMLAFEEEHPDKYILNLLHVILGGNMSSRLFNEIREKRGLAYSITTSIKYFKDTGMFLVRAGVDHHRAVEAVDLILQELKKIRDGGIAPGELKRAKDYYVGQVRLGLEDTLDHMLWMADSLVGLGYVRTLQEIIGKVRQVRAGDIRRVADQVLAQNRLNLSMVGPLTDQQEHDLRGLFGACTVG